MKKWISEVPAVCDICQKPIKDVFIDGATAFGPWACMCPSCHKRSGLGLGMGAGQKYIKDSKGDFIQSKV